MIRSVTILLILISSNYVFSQTGFIIQPDIGYFAFHSDNSLPITEKADLGLNYGMGIGYQFGLTETLLGMVRLFYCYGSRTIYVEEYADEYGNITGEFSNKLIQQSFPIDMSILYRYNETIYIGGGPSIAGSNHAIIFQKEDKFNSLGIGANIIIQKYISLNTSGSINLILDGTLRYIKSIKHFPNGRDLSDYDLDFLQLQISIGLGI
jgi:hypothetical protein